MKPEHAIDDPMRRIKLAVVHGQEVMLLTKGALDDNDHFALGDYGNEYGEYRWGVFSRFIQRMLRNDAPRVTKYFRDQSNLFRLPVSEVTVELQLDHEIADGRVRYQLRDGKRVEVSKQEFERLVVEDMRFALAVHSERIVVQSVPRKGGGKVLVKISPTLAAKQYDDYIIHKKQGGWKAWSSYFGNAEGQPLIVVAQTAREKSLMVDDDLSDFYMGKVTSGVPEKSVRVTLHSSGCAEFKESLEMHQLDCAASNFTTDDLSVTAPQSPFYELAAKEKLSGDLGAAAESSLKRIYLKTGTHKWPNLVNLHVLSVESAQLEIFEGQGLTGEVGLKELTGSIPKGAADILHIHTCALPATAVDALTPGGLILVEGLTCTDSGGFNRFMEKARAIGAVAIGRRIAVIIKDGVYRHDPNLFMRTLEKIKGLRGRPRREDDGDDGDGADEDHTYRPGDEI